MPGRATFPMDEKIPFAEMFHGVVFTFAGLSAFLQICRKNVHKGLERWQADGRDGLDRSHAPPALPSTGCARKCPPNHSRSGDAGLRGAGQEPLRVAHCPLRLDRRP